MRLSHYFAPTRRDLAKQDSVNAHLLLKAGYIAQVAAGVFTLLPLGWRVTRKIEQIIREEMEAIGANELLMSSLQPRSIWEATGRWQDPSLREVLYVEENQESCFAPTHEELSAWHLASVVQSWRDLPIALFQFQTKFRREKRPRSGILRGREFLMKDLYSFHVNQEDHDRFYEQVARAYQKAFTRMGLETVRTKASGGFFSRDFSDEFQVVCPTGEDEIYYDKDSLTGYNKEVINQIEETKRAKLERVRAIEVGNIFKLGTKFSQPLGLMYADDKGERHPVVMGSYGIGITRTLGAIAEVHNDKDGLKWPLSVAPFAVYLIDLTDSSEGEKIEKELTKAGIEVLFDDRSVAAGVKLVDSDLFGVPVRLVISPKTVSEKKVEWKDRLTGKVELVERVDIVKKLAESLSRLERQQKDS